MRESSTPTARFFFDRDMDGAEIVPFAGGRAAVFTARSPGKASPNEDAVALVGVSADHGVLAVADGAGGLPSGERASRLALEVLASAIQEAAASRPDAGNGAPGLSTSIVDAIGVANQRILEAGGGATTLAAAEVVQGVVRAYHVGDSTILLSGQRGRLKLQTVAHSPVGYAVESGMLGEEEAMVHEDRHLVSNLLGSADMRIEIGSAVTLARRDTLLIASDGLSDNVYSAEIVECVRKGPLERAASELCAISQRRMGKLDEGHPSKPDDLSFIVFRPGG